MSLLEHPETRQSLKRFTWEQLAKDIHVEIFGDESNDSIDRRLQLKIWKELDKRYKDGTIPVNGADGPAELPADEEKADGETPIIDALLGSDDPMADNTEHETETVETAEPEAEVAEPEAAAVPEVTADAGDIAAAWINGDPVPQPPKPKKAGKKKRAKKTKKAKGEPKSRRQELSDELDYRGLSKPCKKCGKEGMHKCCPQCDAEAKGVDEVNEIFGFRPTKVKKGEKSKIRIIQTWCRACRRKSSSSSKKAAAETKKTEKEESPKD